MLLRSPPPTHRVRDHPTAVRREQQAIFPIPIPRGLRAGSPLAPQPGSSPSIHSRRPLKLLTRTPYPAQKADVAPELKVEKVLVRAEHAPLSDLLPQRDAARLTLRYNADKPAPH